MCCILSSDIRVRRSEALLILGCLLFGGMISSTIVPAHGFPGLNTMNLRTQVIAAVEGAGIKDANPNTYISLTNATANKPVGQDPFKLRDSESNVVNSSAAQNKHHNKQDLVGTQEKNLPCDVSDNCSDSGRSSQNRFNNKISGEIHGTAENDKLSNSELHFELPIDIPFP